MPRLTDSFGAYYPPSQELLGSVFASGLIALDANVLLNLYRYLPSARDELFKVLEKLQDNLWIPHQVGLEFSRRRLSAIRDHESTFDALNAHLDASLQTTTSQINAFANRVSLDPSTKAHLTTQLEGAVKSIRDEIEKIKSGIRKAGVSEDPVIGRLDVLLENKIGQALDKKELESAVAEAARRAESNLPPGYKDKKKDDSTGDYVLWHQLILQASKRRVPVLLVTDDVKEDWWRKDQGRALGPRPELYEEMVEKAEVPFLIMTTSSFLRSANKYVDAAVSVATIEAAQEVVTNYYERGSSSISREVESLISQLEADLAYPGGRGAIQHMVFAREVHALLCELPGATVERLDNGSGFVVSLNDQFPVFVVTKFFDTSSQKLLRSQLRRFAERKLNPFTSQSLAGVLLVTNVEIPKSAREEISVYMDNLEIVVWDGDSGGTLNIINALRRIEEST